MTTQQPSVGRIVHYTLSTTDADEINRRRKDFRVARSAEVGSGFIGHVGNVATAGDVCPAVVVRTFGPDVANLQVLLDGNDSYWATSRSEGSDQGYWAWPARV